MTVTLPISSQFGSSPLARGTLSHLFGDVGFGRLIPARAGNTVRRSDVQPPRSAHPRSRGEHSTRTAATGSTNGSSPLARGTLNITTFKPLNPRLIPARAGNTRLHLLDKAIYTAHPRSRGEHSPGRGVFGFLGGSSPLARGTRKDSVELRSAARLIPARAGNTRSFWV